MATKPPKRRKYETPRRNFESRIDPKHLQVDRSEWIQPVRVPAPITLPVLPDHGITDASIGLDPDDIAQIRAETYLSAVVGKQLRDRADARRAARRAA